MFDWMSVLGALAGGAVAAGAALYLVGRRVERSLATAAAQAAAVASERLLEEARQRLVLAAKEEGLQAREVFEQEASRRPRGKGRRRGTPRQPPPPPEGRERRPPPPAPARRGR